MLSCWAEIVALLVQFLTQPSNSPSSFRPFLTFPTPPTSQNCRCGSKIKRDLSVMQECNNKLPTYKHRHHLELHAHVPAWEEKPAHEHERNHKTQCSIWALEICRFWDLLSRWMLNIWQGNREKFGFPSFSPVNDGNLKMLQGLLTNLPVYESA